MFGLLLGVIEGRCNETHIVFTLDHSALFCPNKSIHSVPCLEDNRLFSAVHGQTRTHLPGCDNKCGAVSAGQFSAFPATTMPCDMLRESSECEA